MIAFNSECCNQIEDLGLRTDDLCKDKKTLLCEKKKLCDTITDLKHSVGFASKVTHEEVEKLNATIDELQSDLAKSKRLQEKEIKDYKAQIEKLNSTIKNLQEKVQKGGEEADKVYKICKICRGKAKVGFTDEQQNASPQEIELRSKIVNLENDLRNSEEKVRNLQVAVDYYVNSVKLLEETNESGKIEIDQLKITISNLQAGLMTVKHELDEYKEKYDEKVEHLNGANKSNEYLQEMLYTLEIEHCEKLHDIEVLDKHLSNYKCLLKQSQLEKIHLKEFFNEMDKEMNGFAKYLNDLQTLLRISNENAQQEVRNLKEALQNLSEINNKLKSQLESMEHKSELKNRFYKAKMDEMKQHLVCKDNDLLRHDEEIVRIRDELEKSVNVNKDLYNNVLSLNHVVDGLKGSIEKYEIENENNKENKNFCMSQINICRERLNGLRKSLEDKSMELSRLEKAYNKQCKMLCETQNELDQRRAKQDKLEERLLTRDREYNELYEEYGKLEGEETKRNTQLKRYKKIVGDLKKTMIELNRNLPKKDLKTYCTNETCKWINGDDDSCCTNCPCQYETIKQSIVDLKSQLDIAKSRYNESKAELKAKQSEIEELLQNKNDEVKHLLKEFQTRVALIHDDEKRLQGLVQQFESEIVKMRDEIQAKTVELNNLKCNKMDNCLQVAVTQEELNALKNQLNKLLKKYCGLTQENEQFMMRVREIESAVKQHRHSELRQLMIELNKISFDKESLIKKQLELLAELRIIQCSYSNCQRYDLMLNVKNQQYDQLVNSHNDIAIESRNVCTYVKLWLDEQKNINKHIANKQKLLCDSIKRLQHTNNKDYWKKSTGNVLKKNSSRFSPCSLNSQESSSVCDSESPCTSPTTQWYSATFKNDSEEDTTDDENSKWLEKIHVMTNSVKKVNNMWNNAKGYH